jgi:hypothetical protein
MLFLPYHQKKMPQITLHQGVLRRTIKSGKGRLTKRELKRASHAMPSATGNNGSPLGAKGTRKKHIRAAIVLAIRRAKKSAAH